MAESNVRWFIVREKTLLSVKKSTAYKTSERNLNLDSKKKLSRKL